MRRISYSGGEALQTKLQEILKKVSNASEVKVGFLGGATYPDGTSVAMVAALQEYGTATIQSRPFFRNMIAAKSANWGQSLAAVAKQTDYDMKQSLAQMGKGIASQLQQSIVDFNSVPLADATIARKGFDTQLIDTAVMINTVGYQVDEGDKVILPPAAQGKPK